MASSLTLDIAVEAWPLRTPFRITGHTFEAMDLVVVTLRQGRHSGRGEAAGVYYLNDDAKAIVAALESVRAEIESDPGREAVQALLPPGGARNALDCAYWDLDAQRAGKPVWQLAGLPEPQRLLTTFTVGAGDPDVMASSAAGWREASALKLKLTGEPVDVDRVEAVRAARPDCWIAVDANQGYDRAGLEKALPAFHAAGIALVEQPLPIGQEAELDGLDAPIPLAADESVQCMADIAPLAGRFDAINIKLDKCGGLTEAFLMADEAKRLGMKVMVGNMLGTALSMGPAMLVGQFCDIVDLDGPFLLAGDRTPPTEYKDGYVTCPPQIWGTPRANPTPLRNPQAIATP